MIFWFYILDFLAKIVFFPPYKWFKWIGGKIGRERAKYALVFPRRVALVVAAALFYLAKPVTEWLLGEEINLLARTFTAAVVGFFGLAICLFTIRIPKKIFGEMVAREYREHWSQAVWLTSIASILIGGLLASWDRTWEIIIMAILLVAVEFIIFLAMMRLGERRRATLQSMPLPSMLWLMVEIPTAIILIQRFVPPLGL